MSRKGSAVFIDCFSSRLDDLPQYKQKNLRCVLQAMHEDPGKRFSVFEATANDHIAKTMTTICQEGYVETDNTCGYPWTKYKLTDKGRRAIGVTT